MVRINVKEEMIKAEEMDLLRSIQKAIPIDSYLHSLFSEELLQSFQGSMINDVSCDIYGDLIKSSKNDLDRVLAAQIESNNLQSLVESHKQIMDGRLEIINDLKTKIEKLEEERYKMICEMNKMKIDFAKCREEKDDLKVEMDNMKSRFWSA